MRGLEKLTEKIVLKTLEDIERKLPKDILEDPNWRQDFEMMVRFRGFGAFSDCRGPHYPGTYLRAMKADAERKGQNMSEYLFDILVKHVTEHVPADIKKAHNVAILSEQEREFFIYRVKHTRIEYPFVEFGGWCLDTVEKKDLEIVVEE